MATKNSSTNAYRMMIQFNTDDALQRQCLNFLGLCGYKKNQILALMVKEFVEIYNLDLTKITYEDIKTFLDSYEYIQNFKRQNHQTSYGNSEAYPAIAENKQKDNKDTDPENNVKDVDIDDDKANQALSAFGL